MSVRLVVPADTVARQRSASNPATSAWVSANAGSGKTHVLTQRVIRCLLAGTPANRILCLTFTKAAAANMSNKVFETLGEWAVAEDAALRRAIGEAEGTEPAAIRPDRLARARRLFAEAIETPGGLKIQTIHAFCESILKQFPLEADLGGSFDILDDRQTRDLVARARESVLVAASAAGPGDALGAALTTVLEAASEDRLERVLGALVGAREDLRQWLREVGDIEAAILDLAATMGVDPAIEDGDLVATMLASPEFPISLLGPLGEAWGASSTNDVKQAERLGRARDTSLAPEDRLKGWSEVFFTGAGTARSPKTFATKAILEAFPDLLDRAAREVTRLEALADTRAALASFRASAALLRLGDRVIGIYESAKRARSAVDFDDLVARTADLLSRSDAARWVQYKLDGGIDHILIDEAQDTNPRQWRIVSGLADEFFAGEGARRASRTIFAVGDEKQSIYSFQGAAPETFSESRDAFERQATGAGSGFADVDLVMSFRSVPAVLSAVDAVFADPVRRARILSDPAAYTEHGALRDRAPGRVEVWPLLKPDAIAEPEDWTAPLDRSHASMPHVRLARAIADEITRLTDPAAPRPDGSAPVARRDVIVLVRKRGPFVDAMNRVLKERGIPVAGQDRLKLTDHIAILDLLALARAVTMPEDDLSLAAALKSPLFGLDDDALVTIAAERADGESLDAALARIAPAHPALAAADARLRRWRAAAERWPTYEFFARVLAADGGRRAFVARLGSEADDVLDEFLSLALAADRGPAPSLARFVEGLAADAPEIKREMDEARDEVRVMTVHGSKGLEASVVFLVDDGAAPISASHAPPLLRLDPPDVGGREAPLLAWSRGKVDPRVLETAKARARTSAENEYLRLLYVAMTRAKDRLIVCGHLRTKEAAADCWHRVVRDALTPGSQALPFGDDEETLLVWARGEAEATAPAAEAEPAETPAAETRPAWVDRPPPEREAARRLTPSRAEEDEAAERRPAARHALDAALTPESPEKQRGLLTHRLLEVLPSLPAEARGEAARRHVAARAGALDAATREAIVAEVEAVLADPAFAEVFAEGSRAEVAIAGEIVGTSGGRIDVSGRIDRLAVGPSEVLVVDYKSDRGDGATPAHLAQLALYRRLLGEMFPGRAIRCALLWTAIPRLEEIAAERLDAAARRLGIGREAR
jgi:ATP-dependent helicase/nuclease subunit A